MNEQKTHYRKAFNSPYLSSADIVGQTVLTISRVKLEKDKTKKTKDSFNTAYFQEKELRPGEPLRPMILNATNSRTMKALTGSSFIEDWCCVPVTIYVDESVRFGNSTVEGLRISSEKPRTIKPELTPGSPNFKSAVEAYKRDGNFSSIEKRATVSEQTKQAIKEAADAVD